MFNQEYDYRGSELGYLDNPKHFILWLCNIKQLNFSHFNTNSKKFFETVNFFLKEAKTAPRRPMHGTVTNISQTLKDIELRLLLLYFSHFIVSNSSFFD